MKVRELMSVPVHTCTPRDSLESAARKLWDHDCGVLPVVDVEGRVGAAITDRDICMAAYMKGERLRDLRVADTMSKGIATCRADDDVAVAVARMSEHQIHRLPVVDADGKPCGMISLNDLANAADRDPAVGREALKVLAAVCQRRVTQPAVERAPARGATGAVKAGTAGGG